MLSMFWSTSRPSVSFRNFCNGLVVVGVVDVVGVVGAELVDGIPGVDGRPVVAGIVDSMLPEFARSTIPGTIFPAASSPRLPSAPVVPAPNPAPADPIAPSAAMPSAVNPPTPESPATVGILPPE
jgi:hypothetical protein